MMNRLFAVLVLVAVAWSLCTGRSAETAEAVLRSGSGAVELLLTVTGAMTVWSGVMAVAEASGLTRAATWLLRPVVRLLLPGLAKDGHAEQFVCMNIAANLLGLGNAATPLGLKAMRAMREEQRLQRGGASREMMTFVVLNTASLQLLPTTLMVLRSEAGSAAPMEILPCIWLSSLGALTVGMLLCMLLGAAVKGSDARWLGSATA